MAPFEVPIHAWLRGPLREWAEAMLSRERLESEGFFAPGPVRAAWTEHLSGARNRGEELWAVLMFQAWHDHWLRRPPVWDSTPAQIGGARC